MTAVENIALIVILVAVIKLLVLLVNPKGWMNFSKKLYSSTGVFKAVSLILAALVLYYLVQEITIIQIFAAMAFFALLFAFGMAPYYGAIVKIAENSIKKKTFWKDFWLYTLIWIALLVWALMAYF